MSQIIIPIFAQIKDNIAASKQNFIFDIAVLLVCAALFETNNLAIKPIITPPNAITDGSNIQFVLSSIVHNHLNDALGGCAFLAYANLLLDIVKPQVRFRKLLPCLAFILFCALVWEYVAPLFIARSTSDLLDIIAYLVGASSYYLLTIAFRTSRCKNEEKGKGQ